jgi:trimethylamine--corrinoid protein Co-methyltransferase
MAGRIKSISHPRLGLTVLSPEDVGKIHEATLEIIETVGIKFPLGRALDIWQAHGARVDRASAIVQVPRRVIESGSG